MKKITFLFLFSSLYSMDENLSRIQQNQRTIAPPLQRHSFQKNSIVISGKLEAMSLKWGSKEDHVLENTNHFKENKEFEEGLENDVETQEKEEFEEDLENDVETQEKEDFKEFESLKFRKDDEMEKKDEENTSENSLLNDQSLINEKSETDDFKVDLALETFNGDNDDSNDPLNTAIIEYNDFFTHHKESHEEYKRKRHEEDKRKYREQFERKREEYEKIESEYEKLTNNMSDNIFSLHKKYPLYILFKVSDIPSFFKSFKDKKYIKKKHEVLLKSAFEILLKNNILDERCIKFLKDKGFSFCYALYCLGRFDTDLPYEKKSKIDADLSPDKGEFVLYDIFDSTLLENNLENSNISFIKYKSPGRKNNCFFYSVYKKNNLLKDIMGIQEAEKILSHKGSEWNLDLQGVRKVVFERIKQAEKENWKIEGQSITDFLTDQIQDIEISDPSIRLKNYLDYLYDNEITIPIEIVNLVSHLYEQPIFVFKMYKKNDWTGNLNDINDEINRGNEKFPQDKVDKVFQDLNKEKQFFSSYMRGAATINEKKIFLKKMIEDNKDWLNDNEDIYEVLKKIEAEFEKPYKEKKTLQQVSFPYMSGDPIFVYFSGGAHGGHYEKLESTIKIFLEKKEEQKEEERPLNLENDSTYISEICKEIEENMEKNIIKSFALDLNPIYILFDVTDIRSLVSFPPNPAVLEKHSDLLKKALRIMTDKCDLSKNKLEKNYFENVKIAFEDQENIEKFYELYKKQKTKNKTI